MSSRHEEREKKKGAKKVEKDFFYACPGPDRLARKIKTLNPEVQLPCADQRVMWIHCPFSVASYIKPSFSLLSECICLLTPGVRQASFPFSLSLSHSFQKSFFLSPSFPPSFDIIIFIILSCVDSFFFVSSSYFVLLCMCVCVCLSLSSSLSLSLTHTHTHTHPHFYLLVV